MGEVVGSKNLPAGWLRLGLFLGLSLSLSLQFLRSDQVWGPFLAWVGVVALLFAMAPQVVLFFQSESRALPFPVKPSPGPEVRVAPTVQPTPAKTELPPVETVMRVIPKVHPGPLQPTETVLRITPEAQPAPAETELPPVETVMREPAETVLRVTPKAEPAPADAALPPTETLLRAEPKQPTPQSQTKPLASLTLAEMAELHARSYQILQGLAVGSKEQAEAFRTWMLSQRTEFSALAPRLAGSQACPEVTLLTPTGKVVWRELKDLKYRFLALGGENGYLIPRLAQPVPAIEDFQESQQPAVRLKGAS